MVAFLIFFGRKVVNDWAIGAISVRLIGHAGLSCRIDCLMVQVILLATTIFCHAALVTISFIDPIASPIRSLKLDHFRAHRFRVDRFIRCTPLFLGWMNVD